MEDESECARFYIDTVASPFTLFGIAKVGEKYTLSFWLRSEKDGSVTTCGKTFPSATEWTKHKVTYTATETNLRIYFDTVGTYYIFHPQLELGGVATDYVPAPEDTDESIAATDQSIQEVIESVSQLSLDSDRIKASVSKVEGTIAGVSNDLQKTNENIATLEMTAKELTANIQYISDNGVGQVSNTTGTFDKLGLTVDNSESPTKTTVTPDGMKVYRKSGSTNEEVLSATSSGVDATNLHAKTYLIVGGRSRFENYGTSRTGCFWIGG